MKVHQRPGEEGCKGELYDLSEAPPERNNHYEDAAFSEVKTRLLELMCDRMAQTCDPLPARKASW